METVIKKYIRNNDTKEPHGVVVAVKTDSGVNYGYSLVNTRYDQFDKEKGTKIAIARANAVEGYQLPSVPDRLLKVVSGFKELESRALRYFKDLDPDQIRLVELINSEDITF